MNSFNITGRISTEIKADMTKNGTPTVKFGFAENAWDASKKQEKTNFFDIVAYGKIAERLQHYAKKGDKISLIGSLNVESFKTPEGKNRYSHTVVIERFEFCEPRYVPKQLAYYREKAVEHLAKWKLLQKTNPEAAKSIMKLWDDPSNAQYNETLNTAIDEVDAGWESVKTAKS